jgi:hypothetical protein
MKIYLPILITFFVTSAFAVSPQFWEENSQQTFTSGDPQSISIDSNGELLLAPAMKKLYEGKDPVIWRVVGDSAGNLYAATGNDGKVIKIDSVGTQSILFDAPELEVQALVMDKAGNLYAGTSPEGKVYQIKPGGTSKVFFDPDDKYIWSLVFDDAGNLYVGTGDQGKIYQVDKMGKGKLLIDLNETNITVLAWDPVKKLLAGSDPNGILYSIDTNGRAFVLFDSELQQVTSIYVAPGGAIYFSAISGVPPAPFVKPFPQPVPTMPTPQPQQPDTDQNPGDDVEITVTTEPTIIPQAPVVVTPRSSGASEIYRIMPDGSVEDFFSVTEDQILDIIGTSEDNLLISTGKKAKLISLDKNKKSTILLKAPEEQITSILLLNGRTWTSTANPGNIYELIQDHSTAGTYYSDIKDTSTSSTWGQISWKAVVPEGTTLTLSTRSGNTRTPDETWSDWQSAGADPAGKQIMNPRARFLQWKADFNTTNPKTTPILRDVTVAYLQQNLRPEIVSIVVHPPGTVFRKAATFGQDNYAGLPEDTGASDDNDPNAPQQQQTFDLSSIGKREYKKGFQTITWTATDQNQDDLRFDVYYKAAGETEWKQLAKNLKDRVFTWDTQTLPDGTYVVKIVANDSGSNPKEFVLSNEKESEPFDVDNSAPKIEVLKSSKENNKLVLEVRATDKFSPIKSMEYSINPGEWIVLFPVDLINDSPQETYRIELEDSPKITSVVLRCTDRVNNVTTIKQNLAH